MFALVSMSYNANNFSILFSLKANNDILAFLSGMPVTRNTRYLDLKSSVSVYLCEELIKSSWLVFMSPSKPQGQWILVTSESFRTEVNNEMLDVKNATCI